METQNWFKIIKPNFTFFMYCAGLIFSLEYDFGAPCACAVGPGFFFEKLRIATIRKIQYLRVCVDEISTLLSELFDLFDERLLNQVTVSTRGSGKSTRGGNAEHVYNPATVINHAHNYL